MTTQTQSHSGLIDVTICVCVVAILAIAVNMVVPDIQLNSHADQHPEAGFVLGNLVDGCNYKAWRSLERHRMLYVVDLAGGDPCGVAGKGLVGLIFCTIAGALITAFIAPRDYADKVRRRDHFEEWR